MPNQWYIKNQETAEPTGPLSDRELVDLAATNNISPESLVAAGEPIKWFPAAKVSKLFELAQQRRSRSASRSEPASSGNEVPTVKVSADIVEIRKRISENELRATEIERVVRGVAGTLQHQTTLNSEIETLKQDLVELTSRVQEGEARLVQRDATGAEMSAAIDRQSELNRSLTEELRIQQERTKAEFDRLAEERLELKQRVDENTQAIELLSRQQSEFTRAITQLTDSIESEFATRKSMAASQYEDVERHWEKFQSEFLSLTKKISELESECFTLRDQIATARARSESAVAINELAEVSTVDSNPELPAFRETLPTNVTNEQYSSDNSIETKTLLSDSSASSLELDAAKNNSASAEFESAVIESPAIGVNDRHEQVTTSICETHGSEASLSIMPIESTPLSAELTSFSEEAGTFSDSNPSEIETAPTFERDESATLLSLAAPESLESTAEVTPTVSDTEEFFHDGIVELDASNPDESLGDVALSDDWDSLNATLLTCKSPVVSSSADELQVLHQTLHSHFSQLFENRKRTGLGVYLLEHELDRDQVDTTIRLVSDGLQRFSLSNAAWWWSARYLPFLVVAAEEGYVYEGNGTDYWPRLQRRLNYLFDHDSRRKVSAFFERANRECGIATAPDTPWHRKYCHIAWPITNAVLPLDMRIPFSETLKLLRVPIESIDDEALMQFFRQTMVESGSLRYDNWLKNETIPSHLARFVLQDDYDVEFLTTSTLLRLRTDLLAEASARRAILEAIGKQGKKGSNGTLRSGRKGDSQSADANADQKLKCPLFLRRLEEYTFQLEVALPNPPHSSCAWLQHQLRSRNWEPKQWGNPSTTTIGISSLLFNSPCPIDVRSMLKRELETPFLSGWQILEPDDDTVEWLRGVEISPTLPIIFRPDEELQLANEHRANFVNPAQLLWVLSQEIDELPSGVTQLGEVPGAKVFQVDPSVEQAAIWLASLGVKTGARVHWRCSHDPSHDRVGYRVCSVGDFFAYQLVALNGDSQVRIQLIKPDTTQSTVEIKSDGIFGWHIASPGEYDFSLWSGERLLDRRAFQAESTPPQVEPIFQIDLLGGEATVTSLMQSQLKLEVLARRDIQQVEVTIRLGEAKVRMFASEFPLRIGTTDEIWRNLLTDSNRKAVASGANLSLLVDISGIESKTWTLENEIADVTWEIHDDGRPVATTDDQELEVEQLTLDVIPPTPTSDLSSASIFVVKQNERLCFEMGTIINSPRQSAFPTSPRLPERLERRMMASQTKFVALQELIELYIAFVTSRASHGVAALHQENYKQTLRNCIAELILGKRWISRQSQQETEFSVPLAVLVDCAVKRKAGFNSDFHVAERVTPELRHLAMSEMTTAIPPQWWMLPSSHFTDNHAARLDRAVGMAYRQMSGDIEDPVVSEMWENADPFTDTSLWVRVLHEATQKLRGEYLAEMVLPAEMGEAILKANLNGMNTAEVAELLAVWAKQFLSSHWSRSLWTHERFRLALFLFERPQSLGRLDWTEVAELLLKDRFMARAIAFTAWRRLQLERLGG
ncbi:hypothetical protein NHH03_12655 [Stieleria sp. TO1_6]|uniref:hypothetical protein n=1 Tax=Stieleria tagensis TaxID=2956795 RepID=UPI00209AE83D|nr:hypothetical protein [Stieleria tagensis]MCO8122589.1 hypothetical protein [Stieleria tagensis]